MRTHVGADMPKADTPWDWVGERTVRRFAVVPVRLSAGPWIWLRWYESREEFEYNRSGWSTGDWVIVERRRIPPAVSR